MSDMVNTLIRLTHFRSSFAYKSDKRSTRKSDQINILSTIDGSQHLALAIVGQILNLSD